MIEEKLTRLNDSKMAAIIMESLSPYLDAIRNDVIGRTMAAHRDGKATHELLISLAAELCVLDDLKNRLTAKIRSGEKIAKEVYGN